MKAKGPKSSVVRKAKSSTLPACAKKAPTTTTKGPTKAATAAPKAKGNQDTPRSVSFDGVAGSTVSSSMKASSKHPGAVKIPQLPPYGGDGGIEQAKAAPKKKKAVKSRSSSATRPPRGADVEGLQAVVAKLQEQVNRRGEEAEAAAAAKTAIEKERRRADVLSQILKEQDALLKERETLPGQSGGRSTAAGTPATSGGASPRSGAEGTMPWRGSARESGSWGAHQHQHHRQLQEESGDRRGRAPEAEEEEELSLGDGWEEEFYQAEPVSGWAATSSARSSMDARTGGGSSPPAPSASLSPSFRAALPPSSGASAQFSRGRSGAPSGLRGSSAAASRGSSEGGASQQGSWGLRSVLQKVNGSAGAPLASASSRGSTREPLRAGEGGRPPTTEGRRQQQQQQQQQGRQDSPGRSAAREAAAATRPSATRASRGAAEPPEPLELLTRLPRESQSRNYTDGYPEGHSEEPLELERGRGNGEGVGGSGGGEGSRPRPPGIVTANSDDSGDDAEWQHEMTTLRQEVGRAIGEAEDARSAAAAARDEANTLRKSISENGSPVPKSFSLASGRSSDPSSGKAQEESSVGTMPMPTLLDLSLNGPQQHEDLSAGMRQYSIVPDLDLPDLTTAELRIAELERSLRIMNEDQSKQHVALAAIGMRKVMSEELRPRGRGGQQEEEEGGYCYREEEEEEEDLYGYRSEGRRLSRGRSVSASPPPSASRRGRSSRPPPRSEATTPRRRPASATTSPNRRGVRWAQSPPGRPRAKSLSPSPSPAARRSSSSSRPRSKPRRPLTPARKRPKGRSATPPPRRKSAGANVGRGSQGRGVKRQQIRELRRTRKEVHQLREEMRAKEDRRQAALEAAQLVMGASLPGASQQQQEQQQQSQGGGLGREPTFGSEIPSDASVGSSPRSPFPQEAADISLSRGVAAPSSRGRGPVKMSPPANSNQDFEFSPPRSHHRRPASSSPEPSRRRSPAAPGSGGSFDLVELEDKDARAAGGDDTGALLRSGRLMRVTSILQELRRKAPSSLLKDAVRLCKEEAAETDRSMRSLERLVQSLRASAKQDGERVRRAEEGLCEAEEQLSAAVEQQQELDAARAMASTHEQASHRLAREKLELQDRVRDLEKAQAQAEEQAAAARGLGGRCEELESRARGLEAELEEQRRSNEDMSARYHADDEATAALKMKLDLSERKAQELAGELDRTDGKMKKLHVNDTRKDRELFRMASDLEEAQQQVAELTAELEQVKAALLDKSTEAIIESKRAEELHAKVAWQDEELLRITREVREQQQELTQLREGAVKYLESRAQEDLMAAGGADVSALKEELGMTQELLARKARELEELQQQRPEGGSRPRVLDFLQGQGGGGGGALSLEAQRRDAELSEARAEISSLRERLGDAEERADDVRNSYRGHHRRRRSSPSTSPPQPSYGEEPPPPALPRGGGLSSAAASLTSSLRGSTAAAESFGIGLTGADTYRAAMSDSPLLSLQQLAEAPLVVRMMDSSDGSERPRSPVRPEEVKPLNLSSSSGARIQLGSSSGRDTSAGPFLPANLWESGGRPPGRNRRNGSPLNSPRNLRRSDSTESDTFEKQQLPVSVPSHPQAQAQAARPKHPPAPAYQRSKRSGSSEGYSSSDDDGDSRSVPMASLASPGGEDLVELRRRLQSFKADTAIGILGKSQAISQQLRKIQGRSR